MTLKGKVAIKFIISAIMLIFFSMIVSCAGNNIKYSFEQKEQIVLKSDIKKIDNKFSISEVKIFSYIDNSFVLQYKETKNYKYTNFEQVMTLIHNLIMKSKSK